MLLLILPLFFIAMAALIFTHLHTQHKNYYYERGIIIKENISKIKRILDREHFSYEIRHEETNQAEINDQELEAAYREAWSNPQKQPSLKNGKNYLWLVEKKE